MPKNRSVILLFVSILFFALGTITSVFFDAPVTGKELSDHISTALSGELKKADAEAAQVVSHPGDNAVWSSLHYSFFLIDPSGVKEWSKNEFVPDLRLAFEPFSLKLLSVVNGDFLLRKWPLPNQSFLLLVLPLRKNFAIVNNYLSPEWNTAVFDVPVRILEAPTKNSTAVCLPQEGCIFSIIPETTVSEHTHYLEFFFFLFGIICGIAFLLLRIWRYHASGNYQKTFLALTLVLTTLRIALVQINFPWNLVKFHFFDPRQFASSSFNASIGDLFLNSCVVLVLSIYLFNYYPKFELTRRMSMATRGQQAAISAACLFMCFLALLFPYLYVEIIYHNSSISLAITETLHFETTRTMAFISLVIGCVCSFLVTHVFIRLALRMKGSSGQPFFPILACAAILFLLFSLLTHRNYWITLSLGTGYFTLFFLTNLPAPVSRFTFKVFLYFLVAIIVFAGQGSLGVKRFQEEKRTKDLLRYGNNFLIDQDVLGEYLLNESVRKIAKDPFIQLRLSYPFLSKASVRQKIKLVYLTSYFDRYDIQVYLYNANGEPYDNYYSVDFTNAVDSYRNDRYKTMYPDIYFISNPSAEATRKYLATIPVKRFGKISGFIVLDLTLKKIIPQNVYPELLVDNRFRQYLGNRETSYAYYSKGLLTRSFGKFNYEKYFDPALLGERDLYRQGIKTNNYFHIAIEDKSGQVTVISTHRYPLFFVITNFAFLFTLGLGVILIFLTVMALISWLKGTRLNYSSRIQLYVYLAFFFPLLAVCITTLSLISRSDEAQLTRNYTEKTRMLSDKIAVPLSQIQNGIEGSASDLQNSIVELAKLSDVDASVYNRKGLLMASSQPDIFENHLLSNLINREALTSIVTDKNNSFITNEKIGKLSYNCSYAAIRSPESGKLIGVLSVPFFGSATSLEESQINVLDNILTVFVCIFILFSFLSFVVASGLTFPLRLITRSLQRTTLNDTNQLMHWNSSDEIGLLAHEYNKMVQKLDQNKTELLRSQKESAWREIAKQVAHEIKNPLTPMKLTLQQWEQSLDKGEVSQEKARKSIELLLTQLETLNDIAGSFSAFARMPTPNLCRLELIPLLKQAVSLHANAEGGTVALVQESSPIVILGDEQLLSRIFSNIILNALQSGKEGHPVSVRIVVRKGDGKVLIEVHDNGQGIEEGIRERVFLPRFTTKKTGSGIGLAIAWQGIEQSGGHIWFETVTGKGTTFFITFPLAAAH